MKDVTEYHPFFWSADDIKLSNTFCRFESSATENLNIRPNQRIIVADIRLMCTYLNTLY